MSPSLAYTSSRNPSPADERYRSRTSLSPDGSQSFSVASSFSKSGRYNRLPSIPGRNITFELQSEVHGEPPPPPPPADGGGVGSSGGGRKGLEINAICCLHVAVCKSS